MSHPPPGGTPSAGEPEPVPREDRKPINKGAVIAGAVLGFFATWFVFALVLIVWVSVYGEAASTGLRVISVIALLAMPLTALALLISPRTRHAGAGLLLGLAIGSVVAAGICTPTLTSWSG